jgi:hypothetical protein
MVLAIVEEAKVTGIPFDELIDAFEEATFIISAWQGGGYHERGTLNQNKNPWGSGVTPFNPPIVA